MTTAIQDIPAAAPESTTATRADPLARAVAALEEDIVFGRLHPRVRLIEDELMQRFDLKRHSVREVLATLERLGLVERRKNIGALVRGYSLKEINELYQLRALLETEAARQIPLPVPEAALGELIAIQERHDREIKDKNLPGIFRCNHAFHRALFSLSGNETLQRAIGEYSRQTHSIRFSALVVDDYRERARAEHWAIIQALRAGDRDTLVRLCGDHLIPSRDAYLGAHGHLAGVE